MTNYEICKQKRSLEVRISKYEGIVNRGNSIVPTSWIKIIDRLNKELAVVNIEFDKMLKK